MSDSSATSQTAECSLSQALVVPRLHRVEKDLDALHERSRQAHAQLDSLVATQTQSEQRLSLLEQAVHRQHADNARNHGDIESLKVAVGEIRSKIDTVQSGQQSLIDRFDGLREAVEAALLTQVDRYGKAMRAFLGLGASIAFLAIVIAPLVQQATGAAMHTHIIGLVRALLP